MAADGRTMNTANIGRKPAASKPLTRVVEAQPPEDDSEFYQGEPGDEPENIQSPARRGAVVEVQVNDPLPSEESPLADREPGEDEPETDEEWLDSLPLSALLYDEPWRTFRHDALFFRRFAPIRESIRVGMKAAMARLSSRGEHIATANRLMKADDPRYWHVCNPTDGDPAGCGGTGKVPGFDEACAECRGRGYTITERRPRR